jgi:hypothetical protein
MRHVDGLVEASLHQVEHVSGARGRPDRRNEQRTQNNGERGAPRNAREHGNSKVT